MIKLAGMAGVMHQADQAYSIRSTWWLHRLATDVPSIAYGINWQSIFVKNLDFFNFLLESGLPYFDFYLWATLFGQLKMASFLLASTSYFMWLKLEVSDLEF